MRPIFTHTMLASMSISCPSYHPTNSVKALKALLHTTSLYVLLPAMLPRVTLGVAYNGAADLLCSLRHTVKALSCISWRQIAK